MVTRIAIKRDFLVVPLLSMENEEFVHWYELGVWWSLYGDEQGKGPYHDRYLIENISDGILHGWYDGPRSGWLPMVGFLFGMVHGGMYEPVSRELRSSASLVVLSDADFMRGYCAGRRYYFLEGGVEEKLTDGMLMELINAWALEYHGWREPEQCLRFAIGCRVGEMSGQIIPMGAEERARIEEEDRRFMAGYEASRVALAPAVL